MLDFNGGTDGIYTADNVVSGLDSATKTAFAWFFEDDDPVASTFDTIINIGTAAGGGNAIWLFQLKDPAVAGAKMRVFQNDSTGNGIWATDDDFATQVLTCFGVSHDGVAAKPTMYLNGAAVAVTTVDGPGVWLTTADTLHVGENSGHSGEFNGKIGEVAYWNVELTAAEHLILSKGYSPLFVRPQSLIWYSPLISDGNDERIQGIDLGNGTFTAKAAHPPIIYPSAQILQFPPVAAAVSGRIMSSLASAGGLAGMGGIAGQGGGLAA